MEDRRVVVTGVGLVSALGIGTQATWEAVCAGRSGITAITRFDVSEFSTRIAGEVKGFRPSRLHREERHQEDGYLHSVRHRRVGVRAV